MMRSSAWQRFRISSNGQKASNNRCGGSRKRSDEMQLIQSASSSQISANNADYCAVELMDLINFADSPLPKQTARRGRGRQVNGGSGNGRRPFPRFYSQHSDLAANIEGDCAADLEVVEGIADRCDMTSKVSVGLGFVHTPEKSSGGSGAQRLQNRRMSEGPGRYGNFDTNGILHDQPVLEAKDHVLNDALNFCQLLKQQPNFVEGMILKSFEDKALFPYLHYAVFRDPDDKQKQANVGRITRNIAARRREYGRQSFGLFDELYSIVKTTSIFSTRLPSQRHTGYIVLGYKLLKDSRGQKNLESSWLQWTGAREVYKHAPRSWNLRRITLHRNIPLTAVDSPSSAAGDDQLFAYALFCEFGSILHPSNVVYALDLCERLRVRNCGHVALYQAQWTYDSESPQESSSKTANPIVSKPSQNRMQAQPLAREEKRFTRGYSHDLEATSSNAFGAYEGGQNYYSNHHLNGGGASGVRSPRHRDHSAGGFGLTEERHRYDSHHGFKTAYE